MIVWMRRHARELRGDLAGCGHGRARARLGPGARWDGVLRRDPRGPRDGRVPHGRVPAVGASGADRQRRDPRHRRRGRARRSASTAAASASTSFASSASRASCSSSSPAGSSSRRCTRATRPAGSSRSRAQAVDLTWLVAPGSVRASLLTGILGLQPTLTTGEALVWARLCRADDALRALALPPDAAGTRRCPRGQHRMKAAVLALASVGPLCAGCGGSTTDGASADDEQGINAVSFALTDAGCDPSTAEITSGPVTFQVENKGAAGVTELEVIKDKRILGEVENLADGLSGEFSLTLQPGTYELYCPNGTTRGARHADRDRRDGRERRMLPRRSKAVAAYRAYVIARGGDPPAANDGVHERGPRRERRRGQEAVPDCPRAVRADRAGRRVVRRPRSRDRRPRRRRSRRVVDGIPPPREDALGRQVLDRCDDAARRQARHRRRPARRARQDGRLPDGADRQRRQGADGRDRRVEGDGRGGSLLAHRSLRLPGQRRGCPGRLRQPRADPARRAPSLRPTITKGFADMSSALAPYRRGPAGSLHEGDAAERRGLSRAVDALALPLSKMAAIVAQ